MTTFTIAAPRCGNRHRALWLMTAEGSGRPRHRRRHHRGDAGFGPGGPRFGGRRAARGDIRAAVLALLAEQPMHGYQIIQELADRTQGAWRPSPGSVYPTLQQLADEELVRETTSETGKRVYEVTDAGRERAAEAPRPRGRPCSRRTTTRWSRCATSPSRSSRPRARSRTRARAEQLEAAQAILRDARKQLYRLLADA